MKAQAHGKEEFKKKLPGRMEGEINRDAAAETEFTLLANFLSGYTEYNFPISMADASSAWHTQQGY